MEYTCTLRHVSFKKSNVFVAMLLCVLGGGIDNSNMPKVAQLDNWSQWINFILHWKLEIWRESLISTWNF